MNYVKIKKIKKIANEDVYNMEVSEHHNFAVNGGYIVHNCMDALRYATSDLTTASKHVHPNNIKALKRLRYG